MTAVANPVLPGCHPDPSVCRVGDDFYLVTSTFEYLPGLPVFRSRDLAHWEPVGHAVRRQLDMAGLPSSSGLYAPTIRHHDGLFWVVCTLVDQRADGQAPGERRAGLGHFLVTAADPAGPWSDPVWLGGDGIDPSLFFDDDGRAWVLATRPAREPEWPGQTEVWLRELDPAARELVGPEHVIWTGAVRGAVWAEGPHLYRVDDRYLLVAAEGGTEVHHAVCVARADAITGPYVGNPSNPVLTHRHLGRGVDVVAAGHADLVEAPDGSWWAVLLAMRTSGGYHYPLGRETFLVPVAWEDGWPVLAPGVGRIPTVVDVPDVPGWPGDRVVSGRQSGPVPPADARWTAVRALPEDVATPAGEGWDLPLRPATLADLDVPAFLGLRLEHPGADLVVRVAAELAAGEEVGLAVRQSERDHVRLAVTAEAGGRVARVVHVQAGVPRRVLGEVALGGDGADAGDLTLVLEARGPDLRLLAAAGDDAPALVATADARTLDSVATGGFLGLWAGVLASSAGRPTTTVAHVRSVAYSPVH